MLYHFDSQNILDVKACYIVFIRLVLHLQCPNVLDINPYIIMLAPHLQYQNILDTDESYIIFIILSLHLQSQNVLDINPCISCS